MHTPDLHLMIATGQNLANLIPALQGGTREAWVLRTPAMQASARHLKAALEARGIDVQLIDYADDDVTRLHGQAEQLARQVGRRALVVNLTGGTKLMTLALVQTLAADLQTAPGAAAPHLVYCDTVHRRLDWLAPQPRSEPMQPVLKIDDVLLAQGYRRQPGGGAEAADWQRRADGRSNLTRWLGDHAQDIGGFFGALNALAQRALPAGAGFAPEQQLNFTPGSAAADLLRLARDASLLSWDDRTRVVFHDRDAAEYLGGGWVEEYAGFKVSGARANGGWTPRLRIEHVDTKTTNELDGVLVHDNRLLLVECKAARTDEALADWVYKVSQLARSVGGQLARPLLLTAREVGGAHRGRAREYGVDVLAAGELRRLPDYLRNWMAGR
jgi:hypothetical protein